jgi:hypothetical protein
MRQRYPEKPDPAVRKSAVHHNHGCSHEHQTEGAERLGDQPTTQRRHTGDPF